ncbi:biosynthetic peptidoglycan transglycosylase [Staphylococcus sp. EZ-P03]|uniref:biosynthetic peptidoglycan transglycosylase n=1 Tax=Staphylococcus sp. EZ-P03 TaxID=2282739 RepID=UPI000DF7973A|nr:biosynthetic peptidoglycan transglycosylase [Staphylococcus sp. EZ-P03]
MKHTQTTHTAASPPLHYFEKWYKRTKHFFVILFVIILLIISLSTGLLIGFFMSMTSDSENLSDAELKRAVLNVPGDEHIDYSQKDFLTQYDASNNPLLVGPKSVNVIIPKALIASEDSLYLKHDGILPKALLRAIYQDIFETEVSSGGSTITQQVIKNQVLNNDKTYNRKANEIVLALKLERILTKEEIMYTYLNIVPFGRDYNGDNITGIGSASFSLFGKPPSEVNLPEAAYLVGLVQSPYTYTPYEADGTLKPKDELKIGLRRQHYVLWRMRVEGEISEKAFKKAEKYDIVSHLMTKKP